MEKERNKGGEKGNQEMGKEYLDLQIIAFKLLRGVCQAPCITRISRIKQTCSHHVTPVTSILCSGELGHRVLCLPTREHPDRLIVLVLPHQYWLRDWHPPATS